MTRCSSPNIFAVEKAKDAARARGDDEEEEAAALEVASREAYARPTELLSALLRWQSRSAEATRAAYLERARGPQQWKCLAEWLAQESWQNAMEAGSAEVGSVVTTQLHALRKAARSAAKELAREKARAEQTERSLESERAAHEVALQAAHTASVTERRHMQVQLESAEKELASAARHHEYALAQLEKSAAEKARRVVELESHGDAMRGQLASSSGISDGEAAKLRDEMRAIGLKREREAMSAAAERKVMISQLHAAQEKAESLAADKLELKERNTALESRCVLYCSGTALSVQLCPRRSSPAATARHPLLLPCRPSTGSMQRSSGSRHSLIHYAIAKQTRAREEGRRRACCARKWRSSRTRLTGRR